MSHQTQIQLQTMKGNEQTEPLLDKEKQDKKEQCCGEKNFDMVDFPNIYKVQIIFTACVGILYALFYYPFSTDADKYETEIVKVVNGTTSIAQTNYCADSELLVTFTAAGFYVNIISAALSIFIGFFVLFREHTKFYKLQKIMFGLFWALQLILTIAYATQFENFDKCTSLGEFAQYVILINIGLFVLIGLYFLISYISQRLAAQKKQQQKK